MIKVLFVCLGNICRSPLAEAIFKKQLKGLQLEHLFAADSAGTAGYHIGYPPDSRSLSNALQNGVNIEHRARQFQSRDFQEFDYILAMDRSNYHHIVTMAEIKGIDYKNLYLMRSFQQDPDSLEVPDPYYGGDRGFQNVFEILDDSSQRFIDFLIASHPR